eukprot:148205-Pelagomonas_calceolata.AAC.2
MEALGSPASESVLSSSGHAGVTKRLHFLDWLAHLSQWVPLPARFPRAPNKICQSNLITQLYRSSKFGASVIRCEFERPPISAKMGSKQPLSHTVHLHMPSLQQISTPKT